ncbi:hypothetical protein N5C96_23225, partial [Delftia tsuruhatensis]|uniref:hypothetical protein n=1 Tax=Delftia tsuruhatensis TaxID=180282 RepID=UPI00244A30DC
LGVSLICPSGDVSSGLVLEVYLRRAFKKETVWSVEMRAAISASAWLRRVTCPSSQTGAQTSTSKNNPFFMGVSSMRDIPMGLLARAGSGMVVELSEC